MMYKKLLISAMLLLSIGITGILAQETITTSGAEATGSDGTVSYTVGQLVYSSHSGTTGSVSEGVQQPYEISVVSSIEDAGDIKLMVSVYPNPTSDYLTLDIGDYEQENLIYQVYDLTGNLLQTNEINNKETKIDLGEYNSSIYFLKLITSNKKIKTFKIIKK